MVSKQTTSHQKVLDGKLTESSHFDFSNIDVFMCVN